MVWFCVALFAQAWFGQVGFGVVFYNKGINMDKIKNVGGDSPTNGARESIEFSLPYIVNITIEGSSDLLFHRWNCESVEAKGKAAKGSKIKKTDDIESYVYRNDDNEICLPGEYLRMSIISASKYKQDPRSPRKSCYDLYKAGLVCITPLASLSTSTWDFEDRRRVVVQRSGVNRTRPGMNSGWKASFQFMINIPEYIPEHDLYEIASLAGRLVGVGDFRPTFGRFIITNFERV
jgi:hypothetical protein